MLQNLLDIHDAMEPMRIPEDPVSGWIIAGAAAVVLLLVFAVWLAVRKGRRPKRREAPERAAWHALSQLFAIEGRELYAALSSVLAEYLAGRFEIDITRLTSRETLREVGRRIELNNDSAAALEGFLDLCDRGKFAPHCDVAAAEATDACREVIRNLAACPLAPSSAGAAPAGGAAHAV